MFGDVCGMYVANLPPIWSVPCILASSYFRIVTPFNVVHMYTVCFYTHCMHTPITYMTTKIHIYINM